jgi:peptide/nickel transport system permease protein
MTAYVVRRVLLIPVMLLSLSILVFALLQTIPPAERVAMFMRGPPKNAAAVAALIHQQGLDQPFVVQYKRWLAQVLHGDLGWSRAAQMPVTRAIRTYLPASLELALWSFVPTVVLGLWLGIRAAVRHNRRTDRVLSLLSVLCWGLPGFAVALILLMVFYSGLRWFPPGRLSDWAQAIVLSPQYVAYTGMNTVDAPLNGRMDVFADALRHLFLPVTVIVLGAWAVLMRVMRSSMLTALGEDYVRAARARGVSEHDVVNHHARRNALLPFSTFCGYLLVGLVVGSGLVEFVFDYHGLGWWSITAAASFDAVSLLGVSLFNGVLLIGANLAVDVGYSALDPRVRLS